MFYNPVQEEYAAQTTFPACVSLHHYQLQTGKCLNKQHNMALI